MSALRLSLFVARAACLPSTLLAPCPGSSSLRSDRRYSVAGARISGEATKALGRRAVAFLRRRHVTKTAACVAAETGLPISTVAKWLEGAAAPGGFAIVRLARAYGLEFLCAITDDPPDWMVSGARDQERARLRAAIAELEARKARL